MFKKVEPCFTKWLLSVVFHAIKKRSETTTPHALGSGLGSIVPAQTWKWWKKREAFGSNTGHLMIGRKICLQKFRSFFVPTCETPAIHPRRKKHSASVCLWGVFAQKVTGGTMYKEFEKHLMEPHFYKAKCNSVENSEVFFRMVGSNSSAKKWS